MLVNMVSCHLTDIASFSELCVQLLDICGSMVISHDILWLSAANGNSVAPPPLSRL